MPLDRFDNTNLNMYHCGFESCTPGHDFGPAVRDHFLIHYILDGQGTFNVADKTYKLGKGQGFLICPEVVTYYRADYAKPWTYSWVGFNGLKAEDYLKRAGLTQDAPIFTYDRDNYIKSCLEDMVKASKVIRSRDTRLLGLLYLFLSQLIESSEKDIVPDESIDKKRIYVKKAIDFIEMNYSRSISISGIANYIGLDRSYMGVLFKEHVNVTPQQYLTDYRIGKACKLMKNLNLSIGDIARSVGYEDQLLFSKVFRKAKGASPREYRKSIF